jgi:hypothetical protein
VREREREREKAREREKDTGNISLKNSWLVSFLMTELKNIAYFQMHKTL